MNMVLIIPIKDSMHFWVNNLNFYKLHNGNGYHHNSYTNGFNKSTCNNDYENSSWSGDSSFDFWEEIHVNHVPLFGSWTCD